MNKSIKLNTPSAEWTIMRAMENLLFGECDNEGLVFDLKQHLGNVECGIIESDAKFYGMDKIYDCIDILEQIYNQEEMSGYMMEGHLYKTKHFIYKQNLKY